MGFTIGCIIYMWTVSGRSAWKTEKRGGTQRTGEWEESVIRGFVGGNKVFTQLIQHRSNVMHILQLLIHFPEAENSTFNCNNIEKCVFGFRYAGQVVHLQYFDWLVIKTIVIPSLSVVNKIARDRRLINKFVCLVNDSNWCISSRES